ncbi:hypothetical protein HXX25_11805 [Hyphobacterium sp. CCMP332]|uniref:M61 family metallopeptidase n=1 Tax=Hyphobacterium sp. CCMP332 TaxID=2749086 RepID=UPI0016501F0D|nr:hypothetical protein [Hyphobacterium sp. CCMP332]QNL19951.1 hypothetical protein HXX25_11805 [Hyphobacterium sp. CCMP332]
MKFLLTTTLLAALSLSSAAQAQSSCPADPIGISITPAGTDRFEIGVSAVGASGAIDISWGPAQGTVDGTADFLSDVVFNLADGRSVEATYLGQGSWTVPGDAETRWDGYRYTLTAGHDAARWDVGKEEVAYRFDDAFYFVMHSVLAVNYAWTDCHFDVRFDIPDDWQALTPWNEEAENHFAVASLNDLLRNLIVVGPGLDPEMIRIGGLDVVIVTEEAFSSARQEFRNVLVESLARYGQIFGDMPMDRYLVAFGADEMNDGGAFAQSFGQRLPAPFRAHETLMWARALAHETLHAWIGHAIEADPYSELQWFTEGGTDYLTMKTLYRAGLVDADDVIFMIEGQIRRYFLGRISSGPISLAEAGENKQQNRQLVYGSGALFNFLLDAEMTAQSGPGAYEAALRGLYQADDTHYSEARLLAELDVVSDGAASEIHAWLNGPFNPFDVLARMDEAGLATSAFGPDEIMVRFAANGCSGSREPACMPDFLQR